MLFLAVLAVYILTLNPSLFRNDSPETITACVTLGVSHPPGYPLHTLLGHVFSWIPIGNPAMTLNFFSAFLGASGACLFAANLWVFLASISSGIKQRTKLFPIRTTCLVGTFCFAFSKSYWSVSLAAKGGIYNLQVVLELALLFCFQRWIQSRANRKSSAWSQGVYFLFFLFSLGLVNHWPSLMLLVPALVLGIFVFCHYSTYSPFRNYGWRQILTIATVMVLVLSLYLYLPLRSNLSPCLNFGEPSDFKRFFASLFRAGYFKTETLASYIPTAFSTIQDKSAYISNHFGSEFAVLFSLFSIMGALMLLRQGLKIELLFLLSALLATIVANIFYLQVAPIEYWHMDDHLLTANWVTAFLASIGVYYFLGSRFSNVAMKYGVFILMTLLPILTFHKNLNFNDQTREFLYRGYGTEALKSMTRNADYYAESDYDYFSILYLREVEHKREDVDLTLTAFMTEKEWGNLLQEAATQAPDSRPIFCAFPNGDFINGYLHYAQTATFKPTGTVVEFMPLRASFEKRPDLRPLEDLWERYLLPNTRQPDYEDAFPAPRNFNPIDRILLELCAHPFINTANYLRLRHDMRRWNSFYTRALCLIVEPQFRAKTWENKAEGELFMDKRLAAYDFLDSCREYRQAGMESNAHEMWKRALIVDPKIIRHKSLLESD